MHENVVGMVVTAKAGRDKGRSFVIVGAEGEEYVLLADGRNRKTARPKKKKLKHLSFEGERIELDDAPADPGSRDAYIFRSLRRLSQIDNTASEEV